MATDNEIEDMFSRPDNPISLSPLQKTEAGTTQSRNCGGTANILPEERAKCSFEIDSMMAELDGGVEKTAKRRWIMSPTEGMDVSDKYYWDREKLIAEHLRHFVETHEDFAGKYVPNREEIGWMSEYSMLSGTMMNHYGLFIGTLVSQGSMEQQMWWLIPAAQMSIIGCYAQTELGHGSNVRGLETTAVYDKEKKEFVLNTPTLRSIKWWPGTLGKVANHAAVYAQLIIDGKEYGVHCFIVQIRDSNHRPLHGIELGDLGPKMGDAANDTGFMRLENVRIPREHMLAKWQHIDDDGKYVKATKKKDSKMHYATMMYTRGSMVKWAAGMLARAVTIACRYSCVRQQGFRNTRQVRSFQDPEKQVIDYQMQRYRLLSQLSLTYALKFTAQWMMKRFDSIEGEKKDGSMAIGNINDDAEDLPEVAATAAGLKAYSTLLAWRGIEDCRKCCGGNGYLLNSGIAQLSVDYVWQTTAEGDFILLILQTGRFLMKCVERAKNGEKLSDAIGYLSVLKDGSYNPMTHLPPAPQSADDFCDLQKLVRLFQHWSLVRNTGVYDELQRNLQSGLSFDEAFNACALALVDAVKAHTLTFMLAHFASAVDKVKDAACKKALMNVCLLFGCYNILESQWAGLLDAGALSMVRQAVQRLMDVIRPDVIGLTDAFDIPDRTLASTIGRYDGNVYEALYEAAKKSSLNHRDPTLGWEEVMDKRKNVEILGLENKKLQSNL